MGDRTCPPHSFAIDETVDRIDARCRRPGCELVSSAIRDGDFYRIERSRERRVADVAADALEAGQAAPGSRAS